MSSGYTKVPWDENGHTKCTIVCNDCGAYVFNNTNPEQIKHHEGCSPPDPEWFEDPELSPCCGVELYDDCDICPDCKEHC